MSRSISTAATAAAFLMMAGSAGAEYYPPSPAQDFDASSYQSRGGIGGPASNSSSRAVAGPRVYGYTRHESDPHSLPYPRSCGNHRHWNGDRCVNAGRK